ncbi:MAG: DNA polymerase III subunit gamma/tau [Thermoguttaceae bacterium]|nr:DNA polymerase III subunit gamma/tau [Thermoguttaceae bacterium]
MPRNRSDAAPSEPSSSSLSLFGDFTEQASSDAPAAEAPKKSAKKGTKTAKKPRSSAQKSEQPEKSDAPSLVDAAPSLDLFGALTETTAQAEETQAETVAQAEETQSETVAEIAQAQEPAQAETVAEVAQTLEPAQTEKSTETAPSVSEKSTQPAQPAPAKSEKPEKPASSLSTTAYQVVARRYRPQAFGELIGQETVARALSNAIETNRVGHAYLFTGARGVGKTSCARIFAKALNCVDGPTVRPCLVCDSCVAVSTGDDVDVIEIDGASNRGVDEIRQLRQNATIAPSRSLYKIYIIDEVHMLTREAFNALLKTLEEPPARVKFIFCTTEPNKIPITILSRCQRFDFSGIASGSIAERLAQIAAQEGAEAEDGVFEILARRANGSMRDAQSLLEQLLSFAPTYISQADARGMLGSVDDKKLFDILDATVAGNCARVFEIVADAAAQGVDFGVLVEQTLGVYRDLMVVANGCGARELMYSPVARLPELQEIAAAFGIRRILASLQILDQTAQRMRFSAQSRILAELAFARLCLLDSFQALETLIDRLRSGSLPELVSPDATSVSSETNDKKKNNALTPSFPAPVRVEPSPSSSDVEAQSAPPRRPANVSPRPISGERPVVPVPPRRPTPPRSAFAPSPDAPPIDEAPPYFLADDGSFETEVVLPDELLPPRRSSVPVVEQRRPFQAPSLAGRPLPSRPTYRDENGSSATQAPNRVPDAESVAAVPWLALSSQELADVWLDATRGLGCILPTQAATFCQVATEAPNFLLVSFPGSRRRERDYCEREKEKIDASLARRLGTSVSVRCLLDPSKTDADILGPEDARGANLCGAPGTDGRSPRQDRRGAPQTPGAQELYRRLVQHEAVLELRELFDAELTDVKPPRPSANRPAIAPPPANDGSDDSDDD